MIHRSDSSRPPPPVPPPSSPKVSPEFNSKVGEGKERKWPTYTGAKGQTPAWRAPCNRPRERFRLSRARPNALGYHNFTYAWVKNAPPATRLSPPSRPGLDERRGQRRSPIPANLGESKLSNPKPERADGLSDHLATCSWLIFKDLCKARRAGRAETGREGRVGASIGTYGLPAGQSVLSQADYAALPPEILEKSRRWGHRKPEGERLPAGRLGT